MLLHPAGRGDTGGAAREVGATGGAAWTEADLDKRRGPTGPTSLARISKQCGFDNSATMIAYCSRAGTALLVYYILSAWAGISNKEVVSAYGISGYTLTLAHLVVSVLADAFIIAYVKPMFSDGAELATGVRNLVLDDTASAALRVFAPISLFVVAAKLTTYFSYEYVSMALTHTAKASEPVFNVLLAGILFREYHVWGVYAALVPIGCGVALASLSEVSYNHIGFMAAVASAMFKVLQNIYTKKVMIRDRYSFFQLHLYNGIAALLVSLPVILVFNPGTMQELSSGPPIMPLLWSATVNYGSSITSYVVLQLFSHLGFTIGNTLKRLFIIGTAIVYFDRPVTLVNTLGVLLAIFGVMCYNIAKMNAKKPGGATAAKGTAPSDATGVELGRALAATGDTVEHPRGGSVV